MPSERAPLVEVFHSIQGEGSFLGEPMVFLRVAVCPIRCLYCDTPHSYVAAKHFPCAAARPASRSRTRSTPRVRPCSSPTSSDIAATARARAATGTRLDHRGEPLLYPGFVHALGGRLRPAGWRVHLETAALDADALASASTGSTT
jgi:organic radical activating enzyme